MRVNPEKLNAANAHLAAVVEGYLDHAGGIAGVCFVQC
jgi:hypothetical protein